MSRVRIDMFVSLDGYTATDQTPENPMGGDWGRLTAAYAATRTFRERVFGDTSGAGTAGGLDVRVGGGVSTARDFLRAGLVDDLHVMIAPILLDRGTRLWDDLRGLELTHKVTTEVAESGTIHVTFAR